HVGVMFPNVCVGGEIGDRPAEAGGEALGDFRLPGAGAAEEERDHRAPASTAAWTARAMRLPQIERGPPNAAAVPCSGQAMQTASVAVPVASRPRSPRAWLLASVAVATALTRA